ncbi:hypothetical protein EDB92DRAFT_2099789 [Lactarius akahatsu]|uniref:Uncharacterized protein n=1 Tax=Lactarius akahatsu TaxID=416441 RepID=A0AAD4QHV6_9AGAM|nr:hypothetical protein EDB92DRAFT_2099789 [Lactarius akahatsu]
MSAICANATLSPMDELDLNIQLGGSLISLSRSSTTASAPSALAISRHPQEPPEQSGTPGSPPGTSSLTPLETPIPSGHTIHTQLEGTIPPIYDGTGGAARRWFNRVELHFLVNQQSTAAKDPLRKVGLTLCWIHGPGVDDWVDSQINWLMEQAHERIAVADPWGVFRQTFLEFFSYPSDVRQWCASARRYQKDIDTFNSPWVDKGMANVDDENDRTFWTSNSGNQPAQAPLKGMSFLVSTTHCVMAVCGYDNILTLDPMFAKKPVRIDQGQQEII